MELGHLLTRSDLTYPEVSSKVCHDSFCQLENSVSLPWVIYYEADGREQMGFNSAFNPLNAELNPICHLLALLGGATIVVVSRLRVKGLKRFDYSFFKILQSHLSRKAVSCSGIFMCVQLDTHTYTHISPPHSHLNIRRFLHTNSNLCVKTTSGTFIKYPDRRYDFKPQSYKLL